MIESRAQSAEMLEKRIEENVAGQSIDLVRWILERLNLKQGSTILELCCGTGAQTISFLDAVGKKGHVFALDISERALNKLQAKLKVRDADRLTTIESSIEAFSLNLKKTGELPSAFDFIFCAYGLYYSNNVWQTLDDCRLWLKPHGKIIIVGPYRNNNGQLYDLLKKAGLTIPSFVTYTSKDFMEQTVLPWAVDHYQRICVHTMINRVIWKNPDDIMNYWKNSTFYSEERLSHVDREVKKYFSHSQEFLNEKWVMLIEMGNE